MRILITGIPGTGKTTIGNYLAHKYGYFHMDMESDEDVGYLKIEGILIDYKKFLTNFINNHENIVMTWGFVPGDRQIEIINILKNQYNFNLFWFEGNEERAKEAFIARSQKKGAEYLKLALEEWESQTTKISSSGVINRINPVQVNVFNQDLQFKDSEEIVVEIFNHKLI